MTDRKKNDAEPKLLSGGNPQIPQGRGERPGAGLHRCSDRPSVTSTRDCRGGGARREVAPGNWQPMKGEANAHVRRLLQELLDEGEL